MCQINTTINWLFVLSDSRIDFFTYSAISPTPEFFFVNNYYTGEFVIDGCQIKFTQPLNARPVALGSDTKARIDFSSFTRNGQYYGSNVASYSGYPPQMPYHVVAEATMSSAFTAGSGGTAQPIIFDTKKNGINANRLTLAGQYSTSTGVFTVPKGGLKSITVLQLILFLVHWVHRLLFI